MIRSTNQLVSSSSGLSRSLIASIANTEISPSGSGLKVFIKANKPGSRCRKAYEDGEVEIYDRDRFFTVTRSRLPTIPSEINLRQESLDLVYAQVFGSDDPGTNAVPTASRGPQPSDSGFVSLSDDEIIDLACKKPRTGDKFRSLWMVIGTTITTRPAKLIRRFVFCSPITPRIAADRPHLSAFAVDAR